MNHSGRHRFILQATILYAVLALGWIFLSDRLLMAVVDLETIVWLSTTKGVFFVLVSAAVFYFVLNAVPADETMPLSIPGDLLLEVAAAGGWAHWLAYTFAVVLTCLALLIRSSMPVDFGDRPILILFVLPIILAALFGGFGPGLTATLIAAVSIMYQMPPTGSFTIASNLDLFQWALLIVSGMIVSLVSETMRRARHREHLRARQCDMVNVQLKESEERYRELFKANPLPMWVYDLETLAFLAVNDAATDHYGYNRDEFLSMTIKEIRPDEDVPNLLTHLTQDRDGLNAAGIWRHRKKDGTVIDVEISTHTMAFNGRPAKMVLAHDVTERLRTDRELREKEVQYRNLADAGLALIWMSGTDMLCTYFNRRWLEFTGRALEQELGDGWAEGVHPEDLDRCLNVYATAFERRAPFEMEYRLRHASGEYRWIRDMGTPNYNSTGEFVGYIGHCFDITERKQADLERQALIDELEKRNTELERFTYTVSHDLKSPLVTILGFVGQLKQDLTDGDQENIMADLTYIGAAANQMRELLDSLLQLSRAGRAIGEPRPLDLAALAREALDQVGDHLAHATVHIDIPADLPVVTGDPMRLREVFQNLLENAGKFTTDQAAPTVGIGCAIGKEGISCFVRDNGIGISPEYQERIFGLFEQLDPASGGTGIGLAIVRRIVEEHGGRVWVESAGKGEGSTFWFTLPGSGADGKPARSP